MATTAAVAPEAAPAAPKKGANPVVMMIMGMVLMGAAGGGGWYFLNKGSSGDAHGAAAGGHGAAADAHGGGHGDAAGAVVGGTIYVALDPAMVVNLEDADSMRFLQIEAQAVVDSPGGENLIKLHMPAIRNRLLLLFSAQHYGDLVTREAKVKLQEQALEEVQAVLKEQTGEKVVDKLYFTSMVMQ